MASLYRFAVLSFVVFSISLIDLSASTILWNGVESNQDMNVTGNWVPNTVPGISDQADFDSTVTNINTTPTDSNNFTVDTLNFVNRASPFSFTFNGCTLNLDGGGITGTETNTTITANNTNNSTAFTSPQIFINGASAVMGSANILANNSATATGSGSSISMGVFDGYQLNVQDSISFEMGSGATIGALNIASDNTTGTGGNNLASIQNNQVQISASGSGITFNDHMTIDISNSGTITSTATGSGSSVTVINNPQLGLYGNILVGTGPALSNNLTINISNNAVDNSSGAGGNVIGVIGDNQFETGDLTFPGCNNISFILSNSGSTIGSGSDSTIGVIQGNMLAASSIQARDNFLLIASNTGANLAAGSNRHTIGHVTTSQIQLTSTVNVENNASILAFNTGTDSSLLPDNTVGYVGEAQISSLGSVSAGENLLIAATNTAVNTGNSVNVGVVNGSQIDLAGLTMGSGGMISAVNDGGQVESQIVLQSGLTLSSGTAILQALNINNGTVLSYGIYIGGGVGGDIHVILADNLFINEASEPTYTIGALNGNSGSLVESLPTLIIDTDCGVKAVFAGNITDYPSMVSSLIKTGVGTQTLSGTNTLSGLTTVEEGTLILTGSIAHDMTAMPNGIVKGTGTVGGNFTNEGTISPGMSIGTFHISGDYINNGGTYDVEVNGQTQSDLILVTGAAMLNGGEVVVTSSDGTYNFHKPYTIVTAGSVVGTYSGAVDPLPLIGAALSYDPSHVYLTLIPQISRAASTCNQLAIANQLDNFIPATSSQDLLLTTIAEMSTPNAQATLDSLGGYQYTDDQLWVENVNRQFIRRLYDPLRHIVTTEGCDMSSPHLCVDGLQLWVEGGGIFSHMKGDNRARGFNTQGWQVTVGAQTTICSEWTIGAAIAYEHDYLSISDDGGHSNSKTGLGGLYALYRPACWYSLANFAYGSSDNKMHRDVTVGSIVDSTVGVPKTSYFSFYGEVGVDWDLCGVMIQPFGGIEVGVYNRQGFRESDDFGWGLSIKHRSYTTSSTRLGFHITGMVCPSDISISADLAWNRRLSGGCNRINTRFTNFGTNFSIDGIGLDQNRFDYGLTVSAPMHERINGYFECSGEVGSHVNVFNVLAGVNLVW